MIVSPRHFVRFVDGRGGSEITIAFLPGHLAYHLGTLETDVSLGHAYVIKLLKKNPSYYWFEDIQNTIDHGHCLTADVRHLHFLWVKDRVKPVIYFLLLKTDKLHRRVWLVTFHRITKEQFTKRLIPGNIVQSHSEVDFMG